MKVTCSPPGRRVGSRLQGPTLTLPYTGQGPRALQRPAGVHWLPPEVYSESVQRPYFGTFLLKSRTKPSYREQDIHTPLCAKQLVPEQTPHRELQGQLMAGSRVLGHCLWGTTSCSSSPPTHRERGAVERPLPRHSVVPEGAASSGFLPQLRSTAVR